MTEFYVDIEDASGAPVGSGPITSLISWRSTDRMDRAGQFSFVMPATDPKAALVTPLRVASIYARLGGAWVYVGGGVIETIERAVAADGMTMLTVSGGGLLRELARVTMHQLVIGSPGLAATHAGAVNAVAAFMDGYHPAWSITADPAPAHDLFYGVFAWESKLAALLALAQRAGSHLVLTGKRALAFKSAWTASGLRAVAAMEEPAAGTVAIADLSIETQANDICTVVYPFGAGNGTAALTIYASNWPPLGVGYTAVLSPQESFISSDAAYALYGRMERAVQFKEISPVYNTAADIQAAANQLRAAAFVWLKRHDRPVTSYAVRLVECPQLLRPMQTLRVQYRDLAAGIDLDNDLYILEAEWSGDATGVQTTRLTVADADFWPERDAEVVAAQLTQGRLYQVHPQMSANVHTVSVLRRISNKRDASFTFRIDEATVQLRRVALDVLLAPIESAVTGVSVATAQTSRVDSHTHTLSGSLSHDHALPSHSHTVTLGTHVHSSPQHTHTYSTVISHSHTWDIRERGSIQPGGIALFNNAASPKMGVAAAADGSTYTVPTSTTGSASGTTQINSNVNTGDFAYGTVPTTLISGTNTNIGGPALPTVSTTGAHTHTVTPVADIEYGLYRDPTSNVFAASELEVKVASGAWVNLGTATALSDGWLRLDVTNDVMDPVSFRPLTANAKVQFRTTVPARVNHTVYVVSTDGNLRIYDRAWGLTTTRALPASAGNPIAVAVDRDGVVWVLMDGALGAGAGRVYYWSGSAWVEAFTTRDVLAAISVTHLTADRRSGRVWARGEASGVPTFWQLSRTATNNVADLRSSSAFPTSQRGFAFGDNDAIVYYHNGRLRNLYPESEALTETRTDPAYLDMGDYTEAGVRWWLAPTATGVDKGTAQAWQSATALSPAPTWTHGTLGARRSISIHDEIVYVFAGAYSGGARIIGYDLSDLATVRTDSQAAGVTLPAGTTAFWVDRATDPRRAQIEAQVTISSIVQSQAFL